VTATVQFKPLVKPLVKSLIREPLVQFLFAGVLIFAIKGALPTTVDPSDRQIVVSAPLVRQLTTNWMATWQRPPQASELDGLIRDFIKEEISAPLALHARTNCGRDILS
jgi:peptidyl-prolyl cis-trans isomerase C